MPTQTYTKAQKENLKTLFAAFIATLPEAPTPDPTPTTPGPTPTPPNGPTLPAGNVKALTLDPAPGFTGWNGTSQVGGKIEVVDAPDRPGRKALKATVTGERAEVKADPAGHIPHGATYFCAWSTMLENGWRDTDSWQIIWQLHGVGDKLSPAVSIRAEQGQWSLWLRGGSNDEPKVKKPFAPYVVGKWSDFLLCGVSSDTNAGRIILYHRPEGGAWSEAVTVTGPTAASHKKGQYLRMGLYGAQASPALTLYHAGIRFGPNMPSVLAAFPDGVGPS